jgi:hypothetical protein
MGLHCLWGLWETGRWRYILGLAAFLGIGLFSSHVQLTYLVLMGVFLLFTVMLIFRIKDKKDTRVSAGKKFVLFWVGITLGLGLGAPILYPAMHYTSEFSARSDAAHSTYEHATSWSSHPEEVASLIVPEFTGFLNNYWGRNIFKLNSEYPGLLVLVLGIAGLVLFRRKIYLLLGSIGVLAIIYALGANTPIFYLFYYLIPGVNKFRAPSMMLFWLATVLVIMAAFFLKDLENREKYFSAEALVRYAKRFQMAALITAGLGLLLGIMTSGLYTMWNSVFSGVINSQRFLNPNFTMKTFLYLQELAASETVIGFIRFGIFAGVILFCISYYMRQKMSRQTMLIIFAVIGSVDLLWADMHFIKTINPKKVIKEIPFYRKLAQSDTSFYRVFDVPGAFQAEKGFHHLYGFRNASGFYDNELRWYREYHGGSQNYSNYMNEQRQYLVHWPSGDTRQITLRGSKFMDMLHVKYILAKDGRGVPVYLENPSALPHAWWVPGIKALPEREILHYMKSPAFNPKREAIILLDDKDKVAQSGGSALPMTPAEVEYGNTRIRINVNAPAAGMLVISEVYYPYWKATVNGVPSEILRTNYTLRGIPLQEGSHEIILKFSSPKWNTGWMVALGILVLMAGFLVIRKRVNW